MRDTQKRSVSVFWMNKMNELASVSEAGRRSQLNMNEQRYEGNFAPSATWIEPYPFIPLLYR